ncbi:MAG: helix-turn-helix domain-containing protein [Actinomycetota bacterium]|nr:helix-turn-helix domain-containing protein [Actinomycetota bacterium]
MTDDGFAQRVTRLGALADPLRRRLYRFVAEQPDAVSRDQAADVVAVPRHTAKFHLDRLVDEGLLVTEFRRLTGRNGPGAGRPAKLYRRSAREVTVSVPSRRYDLAGQVLADAVERSLDGVPMADAVSQAADNAARVVVEAAHPEDGQQLNRIGDVLAPLGYEPRVEFDEADEGAGDLVLGNCPFDRLASDHRDLVCGMNREFVGAVARRLQCDDVEARLDQDASRCCVRVVRRQDVGPDAT